MWFLILYFGLLITMFIGMFWQSITIIKLLKTTNYNTEEINAASKGLIRIYISKANLVFIAFLTSVITVILLIYLMFYQKEMDAFVKANGIFTFETLWFAMLGLLCFGILNMLDDTWKVYRDSKK